MTRTTELLKELAQMENNFSDRLERRQLKSQLRGRLDALKEEVEFLEDNIEDELECDKCKNKLFFLRCAEREYCNKCGSMRTFRKLNKIEKRLASIQEEIKLIEKEI